MIHEAIYSILKTVEAKCYPGAVEQEDPPPWIIHRQLGLTPHPSKDGASKDDWLDYQIGYWAETKAEVQTMAAAGRAILDEYKGIIDGLVIEKIRITDQKSDFDDASNLYAILQNYKIWIKI